MTHRRPRHNHRHWHTEERHTAGKGTTTGTSTQKRKGTTTGTGTQKRDKVAIDDTETVARKDADTMMEKSVGVGLQRKVADQSRAGGVGLRGALSAEVKPGFDFV